MFKYDNGVAKKLSVDTGIADDSYQQVKSGLAAGDRIITGPNRVLRNLQDNDKVREKTQEETNKENGVKQ